jgi:hypothetical protein
MKGPFGGSSVSCFVVTIGLIFIPWVGMLSDHWAAPVIASLLCFFVVFIVFIIHFLFVYFKVDDAKIWLRLLQFCFVLFRPWQFTLKANEREGCV